MEDRQCWPKIVHEVDFTKAKGTLGLDTLFPLLNDSFLTLESHTAVPDRTSSFLPVLATDTHSSAVATENSTFKPSRFAEPPFLPPNGSVVVPERALVSTGAFTLLPKDTRLRAYECLVGWAVRR